MPIAEVISSIYGVVAKVLHFSAKTIDNLEPKQKDRNQRAKITGQGKQRVASSNNQRADYSKNYDIKFVPFVTNN